MDSSTPLDFSEPSVSGTFKETNSGEKNYDSNTNDHYYVLVTRASKYNKSSSNLPSFPKNRALRSKPKK